MLCNFNKTEWDNPPYSYNNNNYKINLQQMIESRKIKDEVRFCLMNGKLTVIDTIPPIALVTDLDGTLLGHDEYLEKFNEIWIREHMFNESKLIYSTGRNLKDFLLVAKQCNLLKPDYVICGVGTEIYEFLKDPRSIDEYSDELKLFIKDKKTNIYSLIKFQDQGIQEDDLVNEEVNTLFNPMFPSWCPSRLYAKPLDKWLKTMSETFDREAVRKEMEEILNKDKLEYYVNGNNFHDPFRLSISINTEDTLEVLSEILTNKKSYKYALSGQGEWKYLDILPEKGGKQLSVIFLYQELLKDLIPLERFLICGDSGNDAHMFSIEAAKNCCVGNAQQELKDYLLSGNQDSKNATLMQNLSKQSELLCKIMKKQNLKPPKYVSY